MPEHPKILSAGGDAGWLFFCGIAYAKRNGTDGLIRASVVPRLSDRRQPKKLAAALVRERLWHEPDHDCKDCPQPLPGCYVIHDYAEWQGTAGDDTATREAKEHGGAYGNHRRWHTGRGLADPSCQFCSASHMRSESESDEGSHMRSDTDHSSDRSPSRSPNRSPNRTSDDRPPLSPHTPLSPPRDTPPIVPPNGQRKRTRRQAYDYGSDQGFLRFWDVYPEKSGKPAAFKAWLAALARGTDPEHIIAAAKRYRDDPRRDPDHTKYPQGWLNDERYNDTPASGQRERNFDF